MEILEPSHWQPPPRDLSLAEQEIHMWRVPLDVPADAVAGLLEILSVEERARMQGYKFERDARHFGVSRARLRVILGGYTGMPPRDVHIDYLEHGKPALRLSSCPPPICFNASHSGGLSVVAVALGREVGVDIEKIRPFPEAESIAERFFTPGERDALRHLSVEDKEPGFFRCWTRKEAYIKARGSGLTFELNRFEVTVDGGLPPRLCHVDGRMDEAQRWWMADVQPGPGYVGAVVADGASARLQLWDFPEKN